MKLADGLTATVKRGPESWAFIYTTLGFALAIESAVVAMIEPLRFPWNVVVYVVVAILTFRLFIASGCSRTS